MKRSLIAAWMMAVAMPAFAQMTPAAPSAPSSSMPMPQSPAPTGDSAPSAPSASTPAAAAPTDPKTIIASEFSTYDKDSDGSLVRAEFDTWMTALKDKSGDTAMKSAEKSSWLKSAFTTADKDKSKGVSLVELTDYLTAAG